MQFPCLSQLLLVVAQVRFVAALSLKDSLGSEFISSAGDDALGELGNAVDVDAPEQLRLPGPSKPAPPSPEESALIQAKATRTQSTPKKQVVLKRQIRGSRKAIAELQENSNSKAIDNNGDADIDRLGGQLQNIMSDLNDEHSVQQSASRHEKKQYNEKKKEDSEEHSEEANEDKDAEAAAGGAEDSDPNKDDGAENVVDGAMAYIRTRLAAEEHKSLRLRQLLSQTVRGNKNMRQKVEQLRKELAEAATLQKSLRTAAGKKVAAEQAEVLNATKRADNAEVRLRNATNALKMGNKAIKLLGMKLKYAKSQVAALYLNLANTSHKNEELDRHLQAANKTERSESQELSDAKRQAAEEAKELLETKAKLKKLEVAKKVEDAVLKKMDRDRDFLKQRQASGQKRDGILHKENRLLKTQLAAEIQREEQLREMWGKESEAFTWQLRAERANASEALQDLEKARAEFKDLRERVKKLHERASHGEVSRAKAEDAANRAQFALAEAESENRQLKGSVPWLEAEVDRQRALVRNTTLQAQIAFKERDTVKVILAEAQKNIVQLQSQYADALQALVVAQAGNAGGAEASRQQMNDQANADTANALPALGGSDGALGLPPPVASNLGFPSSSASLLDLGRDSTSLNSMMDGGMQAAGKVDLKKASGGLNAVLRGMRR